MPIKPRETTKPDSTKLLVASGISRTIDRKSLLQNISVTIKAGDRLGISGPTGSGKSVFLRSLAMLDPNGDGEIRYRGKHIVSSSVPEYRSQVIYVHQTPSFQPGSVEETLKHPFVLAVHRNKSFDSSRIKKWLDKLQLGSDFLSQSTQDLSGGETQIVSLLRILQLNPSILLLDEPTSALDRKMTKRVEDLIDSWLLESSTQRAYLWVSHEAHQLDRVSSRILKMKEGVLTGEVVDG